MASRPNGANKKVKNRFKRHCLICGSKDMLRPSHFGLSHKDFEDDASFDDETAWADCKGVSCELCDLPLKGKFKDGSTPM